MKYFSVDPRQESMPLTSITSRTPHRVPCAFAVLTLSSLERVCIILKAQRDILPLPDWSIDCYLRWKDALLTFLVIGPSTYVPFAMSCKSRFNLYAQVHPGFNPKHKSKPVVERYLKIPFKSPPFGRLHSSRHPHSSVATMSLALPMSLGQGASESSSRHQKNDILIRYRR